MLQVEGTLEIVAIFVVAIVGMVVNVVWQIRSARRSRAGLARAVAAVEA